MTRCADCGGPLPVDGSQITIWDDERQARVPVCGCVYADQDDSERDEAYERGNKSWKQDHGGEL